MELTGLANRRGFLEVGSKVLELCQERNRSVHLIFLDLDKFKNINDTLGHEAGDEALKKFANCLTAEFRESDIIGRLGGDEFVVLCSGLDDPSVPVERFRSNQKVQVGQFTLQFSAGSAQFDPGVHSSLEDLLAASDKEMYQNKERN